MNTCRSASWRRSLGSTKPNWLHHQLEVRRVDFWLCPHPHPILSCCGAGVNGPVSIPEDGLKDLPMYMSPVIPMTAEEFDGSELDTFFRKVGIGTEC